MNAIKDLMDRERKAGGVLDIDADTISDIDAYQPGYIDKDLEDIVGLQTDAPRSTSGFNLRP